MSWSATADSIEISVADEGAGISSTANLFIPMGIGLTLARQIAEAHDGALTLSNGVGGGAVARLRLPRR
jgi:signal transduction histidine kinase